MEEQDQDRETLGTASQNREQDWDAYVEALETSKVPAWAKTRGIRTTLGGPQQEGTAPTGPEGERDEDEEAYSSTSPATPRGPRPQGGGVRQ